MTGRVQEWPAVAEPGRVVAVSPAERGADGRWSFGSGYLVAPRLVITAAHVLPDPGIVVRVRQRALRAEARVVWSGLDVALLRIDDPDWAPPVAGTCRWGRFTTATAGISCTAIGYPLSQVPTAERSEEERTAEQIFGHVNPITGEPVGSQVAGRYAISVDDATPMTTLRGRTPWEGASGSAAVCGPGLVVGVVVTDELDYQHGRLTAVRAERLFGQPGFREAVAAMTGRPPWLESVELVPLLSGPARIRPGAPVDLLRAENEVVGFRGREGELGRLHDWCDDRRGLSARLLYGGGGQGKTRLARELISRQREAGWFAGELRRSIDPERLWMIGSITGPTLYVLDYAETATPDGVDAIIRELAAYPGEHPIRLLLLARTAGEWWEELRDRLLVDAEAVGLAPLEESPEGRAEAYRRATADFAAARALPVGDRAVPDLSAAGYESVLAVHMRALADLLQAGPDPVGGAGGAPEDILLDHEARYWVAYWRERAGFTEPLHRRLLRRAVAAATLYGAGSRSETITLLKRLPGWTDERSNVLEFAADWLHELYPAPADGYLGALQPDPLGEHLVARAVRDSPDLVAALLPAGEAAQIERGLTVLSRIAARDDGLAGLTTATFAAAPRALSAVAVTVAVRAEQPGPLVDGLRAALATLLGGEGADEDTVMALAEIADALPPSTAVLAEYAVEVMTALADQVLPAPGAVPAVLDCEVLASLSLRLSMVGRYAEALATSERAGRLLDEAATSERAGRLLDEAATSERAGRLLDEAAGSEGSPRLPQTSAAGDGAGEETGRLPEGSAAEEEAGRLPEGGAEGENAGRVAETGHVDGEAVRSARLMVLISVSVALSNLRRFEDAARVQQTILEMVQQRETGDGGMFILSNLSLMLQQAGRTAEAVAAATTIDALLAGQIDRDDLEPVTRSQALAGLASAESRVERRIELLTEAVAGMREAARARPDSYAFMLAMHLLMLGGALYEGDQNLLARATLDESVEILIGLRPSNPGLVGKPLAMALLALGGVLCDLGRHAEALEPLETAVECFREVFADELDDELASALALLVDVREELEQFPEMEAAAEAALEVYRGLVTPEPTGYRPMLARLMRDRARAILEQRGASAAAGPMEEALRLDRELYGVDPGRFRMTLVRSLGTVAGVCFLAHRFDEATVLLDEKRKLLLNTGAKGSPAEREELADALLAQARIHQIEMRLDLAEPAAREAAELYRSVMEALPDRATRLETEHCGAVEILASATAQRGAYEDAETAFREVIALRRRHAATDLESVVLLASSLVSLVGMLVDAGRAAEAIDPAEEAVRLTRTATHSAFGRELAFGNALAVQAFAYAANGDHDRAVTSAGEAIDLLENLEPTWELLAVLRDAALMFLAMTYGTLLPVLGPTTDPDRVITLIGLCLQYDRFDILRMFAGPAVELVRAADDGSADAADVLTLTLMTAACDRILGDEPHSGTVLLAEANTRRPTDGLLELLTELNALWCQHTEYPRQPWMITE